MDETKGFSAYPLSIFYHFEKLKFKDKVLAEELFKLLFIQQVNLSVKLVCINTSLQYIQKGKSLLVPTCHTPGNYFADSWQGW